MKKRSSSKLRSMESQALGSDYINTLNEATTEEISTSHIPSERMLVHSGNMDLMTPENKAPATATKIENMVTSEGGYLENKSSYHGRHPSLSLTVRIPSHKFHDFLSQLQEIGRVTHMSFRSNDVTDSFVDATTRAATLQASIKSLRTLMGQAGTVDEVLQVQKELNRLTQEYESHKAIADRLKKQATMSTLEIRIEEDRDGNDPESQGGFGSTIWATFCSAIADVSSSFEFVVSALVYASVIVGALAVPAWLCYLVVRACEDSGKRQRTVLG